MLKNIENVFSKMHLKQVCKSFKLLLQEQLPFSLERHEHKAFNSKSRTKEDIMTRVGYYSIERHVVNSQRLFKDNLY